MSGLWFDPKTNAIVTERPSYLWEPPEKRSCQQMCEVIAASWRQSGQAVTWWEVYTYSPYGELFMIPEWYDDAVLFLAASDPDHWRSEAVNRFGPNLDGIDPDL